MSHHPHWLQELTDQMCQSIETEQSSTEIGCHVHQEGNSWEISLFHSAIELVGGPYDGQRVAPLFFVDIAAVVMLFDVVESAYWQTQPHDEHDELRQHFAIEGTIGENKVILRILAESPDRFSSGCQIHTLDQKIVRSW